MKQLLFLALLFVSATSFGQIKIDPVNIGRIPKIATDLLVRVLPFETTATTCNLYYELKTDSGVRLEEGNISLTEEEFESWGQSNRFLEDLVLCALGLARKTE